MKKILVAAVVVSCMFPAVVSADSMAHWANVRDDAGNIIGTVNIGETVEDYGVCLDNPGRTMIYSYDTGIYGSVASVYLYGGTDYEYENPTEYSGYNSYSYGYEYAQDYGYNYGYDYSYYPDPSAAYIPEEEDRFLYQPQYYVEDESYGEPQYYDYEEQVPAEETYRADLYQVGDYSGEGLWVDVNLTAQTVSLYSGNNLIASGYCVTGMPGYYETPVGTHYVMSKEANATLRGENPDGTMYACPVSYWMPFTESGCGLHDATWRDSFGGDIWQSSGSYGCVNMDLGMAETIFYSVDVGTPVEVHW